MRFAVSAVLLASAAVFGAACGPPPPLYAAESGTAVVDGNAREWPASLRPVPREGGLRIGLRTSDDALYAVVIAGDERQKRRISAGGLRLWLDPAGGTERVLGLGFPLPIDPGVARGGTLEQRRFNDRLDRITVQRLDSPTQTFPLRSLDGVEADAEWTDRALVVEFRVPFGTGPVAVQPGASLGVGVELLDVGGAARQQRAAGGSRGGAAEAEGADAPTVTRWFQIALDATSTT